MSLTLSLGILADVCDDLETGNAATEDEDREFLEAFERHLDQINSLLEDAGLPGHDEPDEYPEPEGDDEGAEWSVTLRDGELDRLIRRMRQAISSGQLRVDSDRASHLLQHSTTAGFFVPQDFPVLLSRGGLTVGSSRQLMRLMEATGRALGIKKDLSEAPIDYSGEGRHIEQWVSETLGRPYGSDPDDDHRRLLVALYQGARLSMKYGMLLALA